MKELINRLQLPKDKLEQKTSPLRKAQQSLEGDFTKLAEYLKGEIKNNDPIGKQLVATGEEQISDEQIYTVSLARILLSGNDPCACMKIESTKIGGELDRIYWSSNRWGENSKEVGLVKVNTGQQEEIKNSGQIEKKNYLQKKNRNSKFISEKGYLEDLQWKVKNLYEIANAYEKWLVDKEPEKLSSGTEKEKGKKKRKRETKQQKKWQQYEQLVDKSRQQFLLDWAVAKDYKSLVNGEIEKNIDYFGKEVKKSWSELCKKFKDLMNSKEDKSLLNAMLKQRIHFKQEIKKMHLSVEEKIERCWKSIKEIKNVGNKVRKWQEIGNFMKSLQESFLHVEDVELMFAEIKAGGSWWKKFYAVLLKKNAFWVVNGLKNQHAEQIMLQRWYLYSDHRHGRDFANYLSEFVQGDWKTAITKRLCFLCEKALCSCEEVFCPEQSKQTAKIFGKNGIFHHPWTIPSLFGQEENQANQWLELIRQELKLASEQEQIREKLLVNEEKILTGQVGTSEILPYSRQLDKFR